MADISRTFQIKYNVPDKLYLKIDLEDLEKTVLRALSRNTGWFFQAKDIEVNMLEEIVFYEVGNALNDR